MAHPPGPEPLVRPPRLGTSWRTVAAGLGFTLLVIAAAWTSPRTLQNLDGRVYDMFLRSAPHRPAGAVPVVVDIDEESLARYGQWPWPRYRVAQLLERVRDLGAAAVALDIVFAEPDRTSLTLIAREIERDLGVAVSLGEPAGRAADNDQRLAEVLEKGPFVLGYAFDFGSGSGKPPDACVLHPLALGPAEGGGGGSMRLARAPQVVCNLPQLARAAGASGFFNVAPDPDGTLRSVPLLIEYRGEVYPSLALAALARAGGEAAVTLGSAGGAAARRLRVAGREIPVDGHGNMLVRFRGAGRGYDYLSAAAVLEGRVSGGGARRAHRLCRHHRRRAEGAARHPVRPGLPRAGSARRRAGHHAPGGFPAAPARRARLGTAGGAPRRGAGDPRPLALGGDRRAAAADRRLRGPLGRVVLALFAARACSSPR